MEILVSCLHKFTALLKESSLEAHGHIEVQQRDLGFIIMDIVTALLTHSSSNAVRYRELGGARLAHNLVPFKMCRNQALGIVSALLLSTAGDDDMATLLGLMQTATIEDLELKNAVLKVISPLQFSVKF